VFDLRYHVASLAAVFIALIVGILIGVGLSGRGFVSDSERQLLTARNSDLQQRATDAEARLATIAAARKAADVFVARAYPALVQGRLRGKRIAVVFVGSVDAGLRAAVVGALQDAGAPGYARLRVLRVPIETLRLAAAIRARPALAPYDGPQHLDDLGRDFGKQLVLGGRSPLVEALAPVLLEERFGNDRKPLDGVVVIRTADAQSGTSALFLGGLYAGLASGGIPAVGVETAAAAASAVPAFQRAGLSTVDDIDQRTGRAALVLLLSGGTRGEYGVKATATAGSIPPVPTPAAANGG
jgi:hypothetical protein